MVGKTIGLFEFFRSPSINIFWPRENDYLLLASLADYTSYNMVIFGLVSNHCFFKRGSPFCSGGKSFVQQNPNRLLRTTHDLSWLFKGWGDCFIYFFSVCVVTAEETKKSFFCTRLVGDFEMGWASKRRLLFACGTTAAAAHGWWKWNAYCKCTLKEKWTFFSANLRWISKHHLTF